MQSSGLRQGSQLLSEVVEMCMYMHESTIKTADEFFFKLKRYYHVTPTSYLEMLQTFKELLTMKKTEVLEAKERYEIGLFFFFFIIFYKSIIPFYFTINYY